MGAFQLTDELQRVIEREVAEGRAATPMAFVEEAVRRLVDDTRAEEHAIREAVEAGSTDFDAGRYTTVATQEDERMLRERLMGRVKGRLSADK